jgi:hypothetical protein
MSFTKHVATGLLLTLIALVSGSEAQGPTLSNACRTQFGVCLAPTAPVGAPCFCGTGDPGRMIFAPSQGSQQFPQQFPQQGGFTTACATQFGVCQTPSPRPIGAPCTCSGPRGADPGQMIGGR